MFENKTIDDVILNSEDVMQHFNKIFPEVVKSNDTGNLNKDSFALWENNNNNISIELDSSTNRTIQPKYDVYIGGPASAVAAALQAKSGIQQCIDQLIFVLSKYISQCSHNLCL